VPALFTEAARFQSWLDVEATLAELTIIPTEMPDSSIHGMQIGLCFRRSLISASGQLSRLPVREATAGSPILAVRATLIKPPSSIGLRMSLKPIDL
jgi:hypothetical protein